MIENEPDRRSFLFASAAAAAAALASPAQAQTSSPSTTARSPAMTYPVGPAS
jgi:hypothetical protein